MRALIVEDNDRLAEFLVAGLARSGFATDRVAALASAGELVTLARYDLVLLDLSLPDGDGVVWLRDARKRGLVAPVLILTARTGLEDRVSGLDCGADDYVIKPFEMDELMARCRALTRRPQVMLDSVLAAGDLSLDTATRQVRVAGVEIEIEIGRRETALLELLLRQAGSVVPRASLEQHAYGVTDEVTSNALEANISRLRRKLADVGSQIEIYTIRGVGYLLRPRPEPGRGLA